MVIIAVVYGDCVSTVLFFSMKRTMRQVSYDICITVAVFHSYLVAVC